MTRGLAVTGRALRHVYQPAGEAAIALDGVDLDVPAGGQLAIIGPSGSGKSTLLALLAGLLRPTEGQLHIGPYHLDRMSEVELLAMRAAAVGVIAQNPSRNLLPYATAEGNIQFAQRAAAAAGRTELPPPLELLADLGLLALAGRPVARLSGGEQQRLAVAVGLAGSPGLLVADEPTSQLDAGNRDRVIELLAQVGERTGATLVVVTHDAAVADALGRSLTIDEGRFVRRQSAGIADAPSRPGAPGPTDRRAAVPPPDADSILIADRVTYERGGRVVLDEVSLAAGPGEVVALLGPSGSGKSSLLALLAGLEPPDGGAVSRLGRPVDGVGPEVGLVLQGYGLVSLLSAAENVAIALQARGIAPAQVRDRTAAALAEVGLEHVAGHLVEELSGGQQQRVALARALVIEPAILLADEMTAELDHEWKQNVLDLVARRAAQGTLVVLATHDHDTAARAGRRLYLEDGRLTPY